MKEFLDDNVLPGLESLNALNASAKHEEEVQQHIEQGNLTPDEVALYILSEGSTAQKVSMLQHLSTTIKDISERKVNELISQLCNALWTQDLELQCGAPKAFTTILPLLSESNLVLLLNGSRTMLEVRTLEVRLAWSALMEEIVAFLPPALILRDIYPLAMKKGEHGEHPDQRVLSCALIGRMCKRLPAKTILETTLSRAMAMCQDTDVGVRIAMCKELGEVARGVGLEVTKNKITAELFELLVDEEKMVSRAAFSALVDLVELFDAPYRREHFYPIIKSYISAPPDDVLLLLVEEFGRCLWKIKADIQTPEDVTLFASFYRQCAQKSDAEIRRLCAFNLPAVVASLPLSTFSTHLTQVTRSLAADSYPPVRRAIAAGLHEVAKLLGDRAAFFLKDTLLTLIQDPMVDVRAKCVETLGMMIDIFVSQLKGEEKDDFFVALATAMVNHELTIQNDHAKMDTLFATFPQLPGHLPTSLVVDKFLPLLTRHLTRGAASLKELCAQLILHFSVYMGTGQHTVDLWTKVVAEFGKSVSCFGRVSYILLFKHATAFYSRMFLRDRMLETVLEFSKDQVPVVRANVARVLPHLRKLVKAPVDNALWERYVSTVERLRGDVDDLVLSSVHRALIEVDDIEREYARQAALRMTDAPDDVADKRREQQESNLLEEAKEQEKQERRQKLREMLRTERERENSLEKRPHGPGKRPVAKPATKTLLSRFPSNVGPRPSGKK